MCTCLLLNDEECDFSDVLIVSHFKYTINYFSITPNFTFNFLPTCPLLFMVLTFKYILLPPSHKFSPGRPGTNAKKINYL